MRSIHTLGKLSVLSVVAGGLLAFGVQAEQGGKHNPPGLSDFDFDASGLISEEEFNTFRSQRMAAKAAEGKQMRGAASAPSFADVDTDGDGSISADELAVAQKAHMKKMQENGKGHGKGHGKGEGNGQGKG